MQINCSHCGKPTDLDHRSAGKTIRCQECGKSFVAPQELSVMGQPHTLTMFPVSSVVVLNYATAGVFSLIYLNLLHDRMPRLRHDDPSATVAVGLCLLPIFNLYWVLFSMYRLCQRINEQRRFAGLEETAPQWLSIPVGLLFACGLSAVFFTSVGLYILGSLGVVVMPVFAALVQNSINELCDQHVGQAAHVV